MKHEYGGVEYEGGDFYCYPNSTVLVNKLNIRENEKLQEAERKISYAKIIDLGANPINGEFDLKYLQAIHKYIFEDIYSWAGNVRGGKFFSKGKTTFCMADMIPAYATGIFDGLKQEKWLKEVERNVFIERVAYYMGEVNALHPFREGNGRTQRIFFAELARRAKYELNFSQVKPEELLNADIAAYYKDYSPLMVLLDKMLGVI